MEKMLKLEKSMKLIFSLILNIFELDEVLLFYVSLPPKRKSLVIILVKSKNLNPNHLNLKQSKIKINKKLPCLKY